MSGTSFRLSNAMAAKISDTKLFYIQALVIVAVVCLPGNIFTAVMLYIQHFSSPGASTTAAANSTPALVAAANDTAAAATVEMTEAAVSIAELDSASTWITSSASLENVVFDATSASTSASDAVDQDHNELFSENSSRNSIQVPGDHDNETTMGRSDNHVFKNGKLS